MQIVSFNIRGWRRINNESNLSRLAALLKQVDADIIGLNEVDHPLHKEEGIALEWLAKQLDMTWFFGACLTRSGTPSPGSYGNALLTRTKVHAVETGLFTRLPEKQRRGFIRASLEVENRPLNLVVTHLDHTDERARMLQLEDLLHSVGDSVDVVIGDFNCIHPRDYDDRPETLTRLSQHPIAFHMTNGEVGPIVCSRMEEAGFVDAFVHREVLGGNTFMRAEEPVRLDYVCVASPWIDSLTDVGVVDEPIDEEASDHRPVYAAFNPAF